MHLYYAIFSQEEDGFNVSFPDLDGAFTCGSNMSEALYMAKDLLEGWLIVADRQGDKFPQPSQPFDIKTKKGELVIPIEINLELAKKRHANVLVKKTLTIPKYLNDLGVKAQVNFSNLLTETLKEKLGV